jgi:hypothetical protein
MKRVTRLACFALCFAPALAHAFPLFALPSIWMRLPAAHTDAERVNRPAPHLAGVDFILSTFDRPIISKFREAWQRVASGVLPCESVVVIVRLNDGSYSAYMPNPTNEFKSFTFTWQPGTIAIVHTHPNGSSAQPEDGDLRTADKLRVPIFTITSRGMYVYDPTTRKTTRVLEGLLWRNDAAWEEIQARLAARLSAGK